MLKRKIEKTLAAWKNEPDHKPLVIKGCRQCGKTFSVQKFAAENYTHVVYVNFVEDDRYILAFEGSMRVDDIIMNITAMIPGCVFEPHKTCLILDEIQDCPGARTSLKFFKLDGRYDVIATGSLLGVKGYGDKKKKQNRQEQKASVPVGRYSGRNPFTHSGDTRSFDYQ